MKLLGCYSVFIFYFFPTFLLFYADMRIHGNCSYLIRGFYWVFKYSDFWNKQNSFFLRVTFINVSLQKGFARVRTKKSIAPIGNVRKYIHPWGRPRYSRCSPLRMVRSQWPSSSRAFRASLHVLDSGISCGSPRLRLKC